MVMFAIFFESSLTPQILFHLWLDVLWRLKDQKEVKRRCVWSVWSGQVFNQRMYWRFKDSNPNGKRLEPSGWISQKHWIPGPVVSSKRSSAADAFVPHFHKIVVFHDQKGTICAAQTIRLSQKTPYSGHFWTPNIWIKYILNWFELLHSTGYFRVFSVPNCSVFTEELAEKTLGKDPFLQSLCLHWQAERTI